MEIEIPQGVTVEVKGDEVVIKGPLGTNTRKFNDALLKVHKDATKVHILPVEYKQLKHKAEIAAISFVKSIRNDFAGVAAYYEIKMQTVSAHFPMTVEVKGNEVVIKNLIGERGPRSAVIRGTTKVEIKGQNLRLYGTSLDDVSQTGANLRKACRIPDKDTRIFQDGIYYSLE